METQQLEFVLAVMKTGSFTQAAKRCFTSRQNIAHAVKSVEREFGVELFWREGKNLKLTDDGKAFSEKAQAAINLLDDMHDIANENRRSLQPIGVIVSTALLSALPADASGVFFDYPGGIRISESGYQDCVESVCARPCGRRFRRRNEPQLQHVRFASHSHDTGLCLDCPLFFACNRKGT